MSQKPGTEQNAHYNHFVNWHNRPIVSSNLPDHLRHYVAWWAISISAM